MFILMISIIIALVIVIFAVQNAAIVPVQFLIWSTDLPLVLVIFCSVFAGALLMFCLALWKQLKQQINKRPKLQLKSKKENKEEKMQEQQTEQTPDKDPIDLSDVKKSTTGNDTDNKADN